MKRIVVELYGMPFNPTYEIDDDSIKVGDKVRVPGSGGMIDDDDIGTVIAIGSDYDGPCKRAEKIVIDESLAALLQKAVDKRIIRNDQRDQIIALASRDLEDDTDDEEPARTRAPALHMLCADLRLTDHLRAIQAVFSAP